MSALPMTGDATGKKAAGGLVREHQRISCQDLKSKDRTTTRSTIAPEPADQSSRHGDCLMSQRPRAGSVLAHKLIFIELLETVRDVPVIMRQASNARQAPNSDGDNLKISTQLNKLI
eukprot:g4797.t1